MSAHNEKGSQLADLVARVLAATGKIKKAVAGDGFREKTLAERREFFENLVVLDGGTIALSVSLLGNLASRHAPELVRLIWPMVRMSGNGPQKAGSAQLI